MALYDPLVPAASDGISEIAPDLGIGHPAVEDVDASAAGIGDYLPDLILRMAFHPFAAEADLAYHEPCLSKPSVLHGYDYSRRQMAIRI